MRSISAKGRQTIVDKISSRSKCVTCGGEKGESQGYYLQCKECYDTAPIALTNLGHTVLEPKKQKERILKPCPICGCLIKRGEFCAADRYIGYARKRKEQAVARKKRQDEFWDK